MLNRTVSLAHTPKTCDNGRYRTPTARSFIPQATCIILTHNGSTPSTRRLLVGAAQWNKNNFIQRIYDVICRATISRKYFSLLGHARVARKLVGRRKTHPAVWRELWREGGNYINSLGNKPPRPGFLARTWLRRLSSFLSRCMWTFCIHSHKSLPPWPPTDAYFSRVEHCSIGDFVIEFHSFSFLAPTPTENERKVALSNWSELLQGQMRVWILQSLAIAKMLKKLAS